MSTDTLETHIQRITEQKRNERLVAAKQRDQAIKLYLGGLVTRITDNLKDYLIGYEKGDTKVITQVTKTEIKFHDLTGDNDFFPLPQGIKLDDIKHYLIDYRVPPFPLQGSTWELSVRWASGPIEIILQKIKETGFGCVML